METAEVGIVSLAKYLQSIQSVEINLSQFALMYVKRSYTQFTLVHVKQSYTIYTRARQHTSMHFMCTCKIQCSPRFIVTGGVRVNFSVSYLLLRGINTTHLR